MQDPAERREKKLLLHYVTRIRQQLDFSSFAPRPTTWEMFEGCAKARMSGKTK